MTGSPHGNLPEITNLTYCILVTFACARGEQGKAKKSKGTSPKKRDRLSEDSLEEGELPSSKPKEAGPRVGDGRGIISNGNVEGRAVKRVRTRSMDAAEEKAARAGGDKVTKLIISEPCRA